MKTTLPKISEIPAQAKWYLIDAAGKTVGKVATEAARRLTGKHRPDFTPHLDLGDGVIVINAEKVVLTGKKLTDKLYRSHSGYRGHLKETSAKDVLEKKPTKVVELAVTGMLPKNKLRSAKLNRLKIFVGADHTHEAQQPEKIEI
ncbi:MAG: 50S ribosomal protein L13 [Candidatus Peribacteraceae bacterium]|nr:50S ribosomal protein L13 [Candidatus Peribacteraceae bacterium]